MLLYNTEFWVSNAQLLSELLKNDWGSVVDNTTALHANHTTPIRVPGQDSLMSYLYNNLYHINVKVFSKTRVDWNSIIIFNHIPNETLLCPFLSFFKAEQTDRGPVLKLNIKWSQ